MRSQPIMNLKDKTAFEDLALVLTAELWAAVLYASSPALLILWIAAWVAFFSYRRHTAQTNLIPVREATLLCFGAWCFWLMWGTVAPALSVGWFMRFVYGLVFAYVSIYATFKENAPFKTMTRKAIALAAGAVLLGVLPITRASSLSLVALATHALLHVAIVFLIFYFRIAECRTVNAGAHLTFTYWVLAVPLRPGMLYMVMFALYLCMRLCLVARRRHDDPDPEAPPPKPLPQKRKDPLKPAFAEATRSAIAKQKLSRLDQVLSPTPLPPPLPPLELEHETVEITD